MENFHGGHRSLFMSILILAVGSGCVCHVWSISRQSLPKTFMNISERLAVALTNESINDVGFVWHFMESLTGSPQEHPKQ